MGAVDDSCFVFHDRAGASNPRKVNRARDACPSPADLCGAPFFAAMRQSILCANDLPIERAMHRNCAAWLRVAGLHRFPPNITDREQAAEIFGVRSRPEKHACPQAYCVY
jgi:hypothetical protein